jgi:23S rRNA (adenine2503-C2)-methyltransferase
LPRPPLEADAAGAFNLIALNPTPLTKERASGQKTIKQFATLLEAEGVNVTIRDTRGQDIDAACGQLRAKEKHHLPPSGVPIEVSPSTRSGATK